MSKVVPRMYKDLFKQSFITNCELDESSVTGEELETLDELDEEEVLENLKDLISELLNFKKEYKSSDKAELAAKSDQFENLLQKLEGEVRSHIGTEHQLQLHIETTQAKFDELEKNYEIAQQTIKDLENKLSNPQEILKDPKENTMGKRNDRVQKLERECNALKVQLNEKQLALTKFKKEVLLKENKKKGETRKPPEKKQSNRNTIRRSLAENEIKGNTTKKENKKSRPVSRAHLRSQSDYTKTSNKRAPSR